MPLIVRSSKLFVASLIIVLVLLITPCHTTEEEDLYKILGVPRKATTKEIKSAYRRRALDTHPDKNPNVDPEEAAAKFHEVVRAFEVLTDDNSRRRYDRTGRRSDDDNNGRGGRQQQQWGNSYRPRSQNMKDRFDVRQAMSRVMNVGSLIQLDNVILDENDRAERNIMLCFVTPEIENISDDVIFFPYPFAAKSLQGIWWEDILQTVKVRFHRGNDLTKKFNIPSVEELTRTGKPIFVFVKRGNTLDEYESMTTNSKDDFYSWGWKMLEKRVYFKNEHTAAVEIFWRNHQGEATVQAKIQPGDGEYITTMLSHEFCARSIEVDSWIGAPPQYERKFNEPSMLGIWKILSDEQETITVKTTCHDLSGHCVLWSRSPPGGCDRSPSFMHTHCQKTCGTCPTLEADKTNHDEL